jgi:hypothetical protein
MSVKVVLGNVVNRNLLIVSLVVFSAYLGSCNRSPAPKRLQVPTVPVTAPSPTPLKDAYSIDELLANPPKFAHSIVTVSGCYVAYFEVSVLTACGIEPIREREIWIGGGDVEKLLFVYDKRRASHAWQELSQRVSLAGPGVVLVGQFEHSGEPRVGFGHLAGYQNELILIDVLSY